MTESNQTVDSSPKVRVFQPKALVLGFHGTIAPIDWEDSCILPYIKQHLKEYLTKNWNNDIVWRSVPKLRQEAFDQHFVYEYNDCPVITDDDNDLSGQIESVSNFLIWQMNNKKETKESYQLFKLVWMEGVNSRQFKVPLFSDVIPALKTFKEKFGLKIAILSSVESNTCRLLFQNTSEGDINKYIDQYFDLQNSGSKDIQTFKTIANDLKVETKDILYVIDYGQSAKCAKELDIQCLLIIRQKNRKIRDYYLLRFGKIESLLDIEFVQRQQQ